jgi:hypothetical protein
MVSSHRRLKSDVKFRVDTFSYKKVSSVVVCNQKPKYDVILPNILKFVFVNFS